MAKVNRQKSIALRQYWNTTDSPTGSHYFRSKMDSDREDIAGYRHNADNSIVPVYKRHGLTGDYNANMQNGKSNYLREHGFDARYGHADKQRELRQAFGLTAG